MDELELLDYQSDNTISDEEAAQKAKDRAGMVEHREKLEAERVATQQQAQEDLNQRNSEIDDSRNKKNWGAGEYTKEVFSAIGGGAQDTLSSLVTLPERIIDAATGEMGRESKTPEGYKPEWDDWFVDDKNPIETKTWWGGVIRGITHFGTLAAVPVPGFGAAAKVGSISTGVASKAVGAVVPKLLANQGLKQGVKAVGKGVLAGVKVDALSMTSQGSNALGVLKEHYPEIEIPLIDGLATNKHDHPMLKTFKNVVEGMGLGVISDTVIEGLKVGFKGSSESVSAAFKKSRTVQEMQQGKSELQGGNKIHTRINELENKLPPNPNADKYSSLANALSQAKDDLSATQYPKNGKRIAAQVNRSKENVARLEDEFAAVKKEYDEWNPGEEYQEIIEDLTNLKAQRDGVASEYSPYKNEPKAQHEGNATSVEHVDDVITTQQQTKTYGNEKGSTGGMLTRVGIRNVMESSKLAWDEVKVYAKAIGASPKMKADIQAYRDAGKTPAQYEADNLWMFKEMVEGRDTSEMTVEEFLAPLRNKAGVIQTKKLPTGGSVPYLDQHSVRALDLVSGDLLRRLRDSGIMSRELEDIVNVNGVGGPTNNIVEQLLAVTKLTKMSRLMAGQDLKALDNPNYKRMTKQQMEETVDAAAMENIKALQLATKLAEGGDDQLLTSIRHMISEAEDIHNVEDLMAFLRKKMRGGELNGSVRQGLLVKELGMVMTNSVLSGPKTPVRAIMGTSSAVFMRPMSQVVGAALSGNGRAYREGLATVNAMVQAVPESFTVFKRKLKGYWSGDIASIRTRFAEKNALDENWEAMKYLTEKEGTKADKAAFYVANMARSANDNNFLTYSTKVMAATDDAFGYILGRGRLREKAYRQVFNEVDGNYVDVSPEMIAKAENSLVDKIFDAEGNLTDEYIIAAKKEATLTQDLTGFAEGLDKVFKETPWARPFFLFARTGVNGLALTAKHTPGFNFFVKEWNDIFFASPDNLKDVFKYGIENADDLANAKALQAGRLAIGSSVIFMAGQKFLGGELHGNGPVNRQQRQLWTDSGWRPRTIKIGDVWVSYDAFEPFNQILSIIGDIGDHQELMGEEWAEDNLQKLALVVAQGITSKSYMAGLTQFVDLFAGQPGQLNRIAAALMNNTMPLSSLRNEIGKVMTPYTRELGSDIGSSIRNRNLFFENIASESDKLPVKTDMWTGEPIKDHDFMTRMFNAVSPIQMNLDYSPGKQLLFNSGYDLRTSTYYAPDGTSLTNSPYIRALYQKAIGEQRLITELDKMAADPGIKRSIALMNYHRNNGQRDLEPRGYVHNTRIANLIEKAKKKAWAKIKNDPKVIQLRNKKKDLDVRNVQARQQSIKELVNLKSK